MKKLTPLRLQQNLARSIFLGYVASLQFLHSLEYYYLQQLFLSRTLPTSLDFIKSGIAAVIKTSTFAAIILGQVLMFPG